MKKGLLAAIIAVPNLVFSTTHHSNNYQIHILAPGETLSEILQSQDYSPLYGKDNWVDRVLKMNHLTSKQALKIKKGYPIILPKKDEVASSKKDSVKVSMSSNSLYGLVGNTISKHQDVQLDFSFFETAGKIAGKNINQYSNFKVGFSYQDKNKRTYDKFSYNPVFNFYGIGHGAVEFQNDDRTTATFEPTLQAKASMIISHPSVEYKFGPFAQVIERSQIETNGDSYDVRRDRFLNIGAMASQTFEVDHLIYNVHGSIGSTLFSQNLNNQSNMSMVRTNLSADVNLTRDYFIGAFWINDYYSNSSQTDASSLGINLKYFIK